MIRGRDPTWLQCTPSTWCETCGWSGATQPGRLMATKSPPSLAAEVRLSPRTSLPDAPRIGRASFIEWQGLGRRKEVSSGRTLADFVGPLQSNPSKKTTVLSRLYYGARRHRPQAHQHPRGTTNSATGPKNSAPQRPPEAVRREGRPLRRKSRPGARKITRLNPLLAAIYAPDPLAPGI